MIDLTVADLMEPNPIFVFPETDIVEAARLMREFTVRELVVMIDETAVGIITASDVVTRFVADDHRSRLVGSIMTPNPFTVAPTDRPERPALLMLENGVDRLPVCSELGLEGLIRWQDLAPFASLDRFGCLIGCLRPGWVFAESIDLSRSVRDLDSSLERVRALRGQLREAERALRSWRQHVASHRHNPEGSDGTASGWAPKDERTAPPSGTPSRQAPALVPALRERLPQQPPPTDPSHAVPPEIA